MKENSPYTEDFNIINGEVSEEFLRVSYNSDDKAARGTEDDTIFDSEKWGKVAERIVTQGMNIQPGDKLYIRFHPRAWQICSLVKVAAEKAGAIVFFRYVGEALNKTVLEGVSGASPPLTDPFGEGLALPAENGRNAHNRAIAGIEHGIVGDEKLAVQAANKILTITDSQPFAEITPREARKSNQVGLDSVFVVNKYVRKAFNRAMGVVNNIRWNEREWSLLYVPNQLEADAAQMTLQEYSDVVAEACDRDWEAVDKAQEFLITLLSKGKEFSVRAKAPAEFPSDWDTNISMNIEGMLGANSTVTRNWPGSEVFLAPVKGSLRGTYALPYPVNFDGLILPNLKVVFEAGKVQEFDILPGEIPGKELNEDEVVKLKQELARIFASDVGASMIGELGIGTNPKIMKAFLNTLLVEKAGGSIHLAFGEAYTMKEYRGQPVNVDNGVKSDIHVDVTRMLTPNFCGEAEASEIVVDGMPIQRAGKFLAPELAILNEA